MSEENIKEVTEERLVELSGEMHEGSMLSQRAHQAQAELTRRLMGSIGKLDASTSFYSKAIIKLTLALIVLGLEQLTVTIFPPDQYIVKVIVFILFLAVFLFVQKDRN